MRSSSEKGKPFFRGGYMTIITCTERKKTSKGDVARLRRDGRIPYVLYSKGRQPELGSFVKAEFDAILRSLQQGFLPSTVFSLKDGSKERKAIVREIQYHPSTYEILHIDFLELNKDIPVEVKVPVEFVNSVDCIGAKLGGYLRHVKRHLQVRCLPKDIPSHFDIDVKDLGIAQSKRVRDIAIPKNVTCLLQQDESVVTVAKR
jgi:large subunit ribosomal protein L25